MSVSCSCEASVPLRCGWLPADLPQHFLQTSTVDAGSHLQTGQAFVLLRLAPPPPLLEKHVGSLRQPPDLFSVSAVRLAGTPFTLRDCLCWFCPNDPWEPAEGAAAELSQQLKEEKAGQPQQGGGDGGGSAGTVKFVGVDGGGGQGGAAGDPGRREEGAAVVDSGGAAGSGRALLLPKVAVQGVGVPLDEPILQLWAALRHPDHFLYIVVRK